MRKQIFIALAFLCTVFSMEAQNEVQALRYSLTNPFGTARYAAQGGAIGALGGDFSAIQVNPAGLAVYRSSEFSFTPSFYWVNSESNYLGNRMGDSRLRFNVGSLGYVSALNTNMDRGLVSASFALGYNTLTNFNKRITMRTPDGAGNSTLLDDFVRHANDDPDNLSPFYEQVAFDANLLPWDPDAEEYWNDIQDGGYGQNISRYLEQTGYIGEYSLSGAFNFSNLLYFGATMGIHSVRFSEEIFHSETDPADQILNFDSFRFREFNNTSGWGFNMRFGMILRPIQMLRVGASFQIPTYYNLSEEKYTDAASTWDLGSGITDASAYSPVGIYDYKLRTPMKANAHASVILFKVATISAAYEYVDYSSARLDAYDDKFIEENNVIRSEYKDVHNLKAGAELRLGTLYLRGGMQYLGSPYTDTRNDAGQFIFSGGMGIRTSAAFFDVSYSRGGYSEVYGLYYPGNGYPESGYTSYNQINPNNLMFTVGLRF